MKSLLFSIVIFVFCTVMLHSCNYQDKKSSPIAAQETQCEEGSTLDTNGSCLIPEQSDASSPQTSNTTSTKKSPASLNPNSSKSASPAKSPQNLDDETSTSPGSQGKSPARSGEGSELIITADPRFPTAFQSFELNEYAHNYIQVKDEGRVESSMFSCPGDSFLVGQYAKYSKEELDRVYSEKCQFFSDGRGIPMRKMNCKTSEVANAVGEMLNFTCPAGTLLAGHQSTYQSSTKDRLHQFECCEMRNAENKKVTFIEDKYEDGTTQMKCDQRRLFEQDPEVYAQEESIAAKGVNQDVNTKGGTLRFECIQEFTTNPQTGQTSKNSMIYKIKGFYFEGEKGTIYHSYPDRTFSYTCCELGVEGATAPEQNTSPLGF